MAEKLPSVLAPSRRETARQHVRRVAVVEQSHAPASLPVPAERILLPSLRLTRDRRPDDHSRADTVAVLHRLLMCAGQGTENLLGRRMAVHWLMLGGSFHSVTDIIREFHLSLVLLHRFVSDTFIDYISIANRFNQRLFGTVAQGLEFSVTNQESRLPFLVVVVHRISG